MKKRIRYLWSRTMAIVRKFSIGVMPFSKMFRTSGLGGAAADAVLSLRLKGAISEDYYTSVGADHSGYRLTDEDQSNVLLLASESIVFTKDNYESQRHFDFSKVLTEFRAIWKALDGVLDVRDIRRIGMVGEYRLSCGDQHPSRWLLEKLTSIKKNTLLPDKFQMRYEEREPAADGKIPDRKKGDFINYIYDYYDSSNDTQHPEDGYVNANLDVQRYYAPVFNGGNIGDEILKLHKHFEAAEKRFSEHLKALGASHGKK